MRLVILALAALLAVTACASANSASLSNVMPVKDVPPVMPPEPDGKTQGGDTFATAFVIGAVPFDDTGTTVGYANDYDESCPYTGSTSPDVVYKYTPTTTQLLNIYTCNSGYDTKLYVYENTYTPGVPYACNDDSSLCSGPSYRSYIESMWAYAGNTYWIVVDGYAGDYGAYEFHIRAVVPPQPCDPNYCPPGAIVNLEPTCYDGYVDTYNGGCNVTPYKFDALALNTTVCGESGNYDANYYRDMDWFHFTPTTNIVVNACLCTSFPGRMWIGTTDCVSYNLTSIATTQGYLGCMTYAMTAGVEYTIVVSIDGWLSIPCGSKYVLRFYEEGYSPVENTSWGTIKALYR